MPATSAFAGTNRFGGWRQRDTVAHHSHHCLRSCRASAHAQAKSLPGIEARTIVTTGVRRHGTLVN